MDRKILERLLEGAGVNELCEELKVGKRRVVRVRNTAEQLGYFDGVPLPPYPEAVFPAVPDGRSLRKSPAWIALEAHLPWIEERLRSGWHAVTVFEELPVEVPRSNFYRFLVHHRLDEVGKSMRRVVPEIVHEPGEALLVDWGYLWTINQQGRKQKLWVFLGVLGYSRFLMARVMTSLTQVSVLAALSSLYEELGGVPRKTTSDNPKVFTLIASKHEPLIHPVYERFAAHYGTRVEALPPREPKKKGKVERPIPYIRRLLEAFSGDRNDPQAVEAYLRQKLVLANQRRHGTTHERPVDRFHHEELPSLRQLPQIPYDPEHYHEGTVRIDGHVRFLGKYYSVDDIYVHKTVTVLGNSKSVAIYHAGKLIETHERLWCRTRSKSTKPHHLKPWEQVCANPDGLRGEARKLGPCVEQLVTRILHRGDGFIDFRRIWGLLALAKKYSALEVDAACEDALLDGETSSKAVEQLIIARREQEATLESPTSPPSPPSGKFQRERNLLVSKIHEPRGAYSPI